MLRQMSPDADAFVPAPPGLGVFDKPAYGEDMENMDGSGCNHKPGLTNSQDQWYEDLCSTAAPSPELLAQMAEMEVMGSPWASPMQSPWASPMLGFDPYSAQMMAEMGTFDMCMDFSLPDAEDSDGSGDKTLVLPPAFDLIEAQMAAMELMSTPFASPMLAPFASPMLAPAAPPNFKLDGVNHFEDTVAGLLLSGDTTWLPEADGAVDPNELMILAPPGLGNEGLTDHKAQGPPPSTAGKTQPKGAKAQQKQKPPPPAEAPPPPPPGLELLEGAASGAAGASAESKKQAPMSYASAAKKAVPTAAKAKGKDAAMVLNASEEAAVPSNSALNSKEEEAAVQSNGALNPKAEEFVPGALVSSTNDSLQKAEYYEEGEEEEEEVEEEEEEEEEEATRPSTLVLPPGCTTAMLRNIPNKYTRDMLVDQLHDAGFRGDLDFLYLPTDFKNKCNVGYVFVSFRTAEACSRFGRDFHDKSAKKMLPGFNSYKVCGVSPARVQGCDANVRRLQNSPVIVQLAMKPEWLPILLDKAGGPQEFPVPPEAMAAAKAEEADNTNDFSASSRVDAGDAGRGRGAEATRRFRRRRE